MLPLAAKVAPVHAAKLRNGDVAFINENQRIIRQILKQRRRRFARLAPRQIARIVLDTGAGPGRLDHFQIKPGALFEPLGFQQTAGIVQLFQPMPQLLLDEF